MIFGDAVFGGGSKGAESLLRRLYDGNYGFEFYFGEFSVDQLLHQGEFGSRQANTELLDLMRQTEMRGELGIEHLSAGGLRKYNKFRYTPEEAMKLLRAAHMSRVYLGANFLHIGPDMIAHELAEHYSNVVKMLDELGESSYVVFRMSDIIRPYIGTEDYRKVLGFMEENPFYYGMLEKVGQVLGLPMIKELPEDDGYPFIIEKYLSLDADISKALIDNACFKHLCPIPVLLALL